MANLFDIPAGIRLDAWPVDAAPKPAYSPEIISLRDHLRQSSPELVSHLETLDKMRQIRDLVGAVSGPIKTGVVTKRA